MANECVYSIFITYFWADFQLLSNNGKSLVKAIVLNLDEQSHSYNLKE